MDSRPFLKCYSGQSTDELIALAADHRIDSIVLAFEQALLQKQSLTGEELTVVTVEALEREVNNGGFTAFFGNATEYVGDAVAALIAIGCPRTAALTQRAIGGLHIAGPLTSEAIEQAAADGGEELDERLAELDNLYYQGEEEPIADKLFDYIKRHRDRILAIAP